MTTSYIADEALLHGHGIEVTRHPEVDNRRIGAGRRGLFAERLQHAFFELVQGNAQ